MKFGLIYSFSRRTFFYRIGSFLLFKDVVVYVTSNEKNSLANEPYRCSWKVNSNISTKTTNRSKGPKPVKKYLLNLGVRLSFNLKKNVSVGEGGIRQFHKWQIEAQEDIFTFSRKFRKIKTSKPTFYLLCLT